MLEAQRDQTSLSDMVELRPPNLCIKAFLTLWICLSLDIWMVILRGWLLYNIKLCIVVILVLQKCNEMCFSFSVWFHLEEHSGSLECVTALFVYLNACDNIRGSILLHFGVLPLASHRSRIGPDVVQISKKYHVCFVFFWTQNMSKWLLFLQTESFLYCSLHGRNFCIIFNYIWPLLKVPRINAICKNIFPRACLWKWGRWKWSRVV